jgi:hypothetical protein
MDYYPDRAPPVRIAGPTVPATLAPPPRSVPALRRMPVHPLRLETPVEVPHLYTRLARTVRTQSVRIGRLSRLSMAYMLLSTLLLFSLKRVLTW